MTQSGTWVSYGATAEIMLAGALATTAAALVYAGLGLPLHAELPRPSKAVRLLQLAIWPLAVFAFGVCAWMYAVRAYGKNARVALPAGPIMPVMLVGVGVVFCVIALAHNSRGWRIALGTAVIGSLGAPMIFEFPFDLIVLTGTSAISSDTTLYRLLFLAPLFLIEVVTLALLTLSPPGRLSRATLWSLAAIPAVLAALTLFGFGYPSAPAPVILNLVSKTLALIVPPLLEPGA
jgi:hypothetical protein